MDDLDAMEVAYDVQVYYCIASPGEEVDTSPIAVRNRGKCAGVNAGSKVSDAIDVVKREASVKEPDEVLRLRFNPTPAWIPITPQASGYVFKKGDEIFLKITRVSVLQSLDDIIQLCDRYSFDVEPSLLPAEELHYKAEFPSSRGKVCSLAGQPCLLWEGVGEGLVELDERFTERLGANQVTVVLAASGSGKTRMLIELASTRFALFFTGDRPMIGWGGGSRDMRAMAMTLERICPGETDIDQFDPVVRCCVGALVIARLSILKLLKKLKTGLSPRDWAFFQLEYPGVEDVFLNLAELLLSLVSERTKVAHFVVQFDACITKLVEEVGWCDGVIMVDEAQALSHDMRGRFRSTGTSEDGQSLLNPFVLALSGIGELRSPLFISGTGRSMLSVHQHFLSGTMKPFPVANICSLHGFDSSNIQAFMERFIDVSRLDIQAIIHTYTGRRRFLATALERYMQLQQPGEDWFLRFAQSMISATGNQLEVHRSLRDLAKDLWEGDTNKFIEYVVFTYYLSGARHVVVPGNRQVMTLLDCGLATLHESKAEVGDFAPVVPCIPGDIDQDCRIILGEPLVMQALWQHMPRGTLQHDISNSDAASACESVGAAFRKKVPAEVLGVVGTPPVYMTEYELLEPKGASSVLVQDVRMLDDWVEAIEGGVSFATYAWTGLRFGGPDVIFMLWNKMLNKKMPVLVQFRTGVNTRINQAFGMLNIGKFHRAVNSEGSRKLKLWCSTGYIRLVVKIYLQQSNSDDDDYVYEDVDDSVYEDVDDTPVIPLLGVWVRKRLAGIINEELQESSLI